MPHIETAGPSLPRPSPVTEAPPRLNIVDLKRDLRQWSLYILALIALQGGRATEAPTKAPTDPPALDPLSWLPIHSIHGWPLDFPWEEGGDKKDPGYCAHSDSRFPTWHRAYLALFEQALQKAAVEIAAEYVINKDAWGYAAETLRCPYWDWADPATYVPPPEVYDYDNFAYLNILTPSGLKNVPNPLLDYYFERKIVWEKSTGLNEELRTVRHPRAEDSIAAFRDWLGTNATKGDLQFGLWRTLTLTTTWVELWNVKVVSTNPNPNERKYPRANSLETFHNWIHGRVGGAGGHMNYVPAAAYDPIFMLHHCNVDRQIALWQTLHPGAWIDSESGKKDLRPFWKTQDAFLNSLGEGMRKITGFGSTYPEFVGLENYPEDVMEEIIRRRVEELYKPKDKTFGIVVAGNKTRHFAAPIRVKKFQYNGTFDVVAFLGQVPAKPEEWISSSDFAGSHTEFASSPEHCQNCKENPDAITEALISLDSVLKEKGFEGKKEEEILDFIKKNLKLYVLKADGTVIVPEKEGFEIDVGSWWKLETVKHLKGVKLAAGIITVDLESPDGGTPLIYDDITWDEEGGHYPYDPEF